MDTQDFAHRVQGVAALAEPARRELYLYVAAQPSPVSRDQASAGLGLARHTVKFHLDRLVQEGLLQAEFRRPAGRGGPGAGRPTKLYRRSDRQVSVALPDRRYDLAGRLMAQAIDESARTGVPVIDALHRAAADAGRALGAAATARSGADAGPDAGPDDGPAAGPDDALAVVCRSLADQGYEPHRRGGTVTMANCPFDALARDHTELVCGMNLALLGAASEQVGPGALSARLDPAPGRCCVVLTLD